MALHLNVVVLALVSALIVAEVSAVTIVSRSQWGSRYSRGGSYLHRPVPNVIIHHTATPSCSSRSDCSYRVRNIQNYHKNTKGWDDIGYNFLVGQDGNVYEGRGWDRRGAHAVRWNHKSIGIAFIGNFQTVQPNTASLNAAKALITYGKALGKISTSFKLWGHKDKGSTACPGNRLYAIIKRWPWY